MKQLNDPVKFKGISIFWVVKQRHRKLEFIVLNQYFGTGMMCLVEVYREGMKKGIGNYDFLSFIRGENGEKKIGWSKFSTQSIIFKNFCSFQNREKMT